VVNVGLPLGANTLTLTATDSKGAATSDTVIVTVNDTTAPAVNVTAPAEGTQLYAGVPASSSGRPATTASSPRSTSRSRRTVARRSHRAGLRGSERRRAQLHMVRARPLHQPGRLRVTARDSRG
jgi:hypothetical protein